MGKKKNKDRIKELRAELKESANKVWLAGLGALETGKEEGSKLFRSLVEKGEAYEGKGREAFDAVKGDIEKAMGDARGKASGAVDKVEERLDEVVSGALKRFGVPTRDEIATLTKRVEELTRVVEGMKGPAAKKPAATAKPAAKKPAAKKTASKKTASKKTASTDAN